MQEQPIGDTGSMTSTSGTAGTAGPARPATSTTPFGPLDIAFDARVLRPRPWTTAQSHWAAELLATAPPGPVLELCAGVGQIGLLSIVDSARQLVCVDANPVACELAEHNAAVAGLADRVSVRCADLGDALRPGERFALVIADPPYLRPEEALAYPEDPPLAIDGGPDGLEVARRCLAVAGDHLLPGGAVVVQLRSEEQAARVSEDAAGDAGLVAVASRSLDRGVLLLLGPA